MIAFVQPFGVSDNCGGARILRALLAEAHQPFVSICAAPRPPQPTTIGPEEHVPPRPFLGRIERTRLARLGPFIESFYERSFEQTLGNVLQQHGATAVHAIPHGFAFWHAFRVAERLGLPYYLNVHDDMRYNLAGQLRLNEAMERLAWVWPRAQECIVISEAMGEAYCRQYGSRHYHVITDGLEADLPDAPRPWSADQMCFYFMGALHLSYHANFEAFFSVLEQFGQSNSACALSFAFRGSRAPTENTHIPIKQWPYAPESVVKQDFEGVDVLYLPLPFGAEYEPFTRYSLSTKLVTYLGSGLPILYHGPAFSAAGQLLARHQAAIQIHSLDPLHIEAALHEIAERRTQVVHNALALGRSQFNLEDQQGRFWDLVAEGVSRC